MMCPLMMNIPPQAVVWLMFGYSCIHDMVMMMLQTKKGDIHIDVSGDIYMIDGLEALLPWKQKQC